MNKISALKYLIDKQLSRIEGLSSHFDQNNPVQVSLNKEEDRPIVKVKQEGYTWFQLDFLENTKESLIPSFSLPEYDSTYLGQVQETLESLGFQVQILD